MPIPTLYGYVDINHPSQMNSEQNSYQRSRGSSNNDQMSKHSYSQGIKN